MEGEYLGPGVTKLEGDLEAFQGAVLGRRFHEEVPLWLGASVLKGVAQASGRIVLATRAEDGIVPVEATGMEEDQKGELVTEAGVGAGKVVVLDEGRER